MHESTLSTLNNLRVVCVGRAQLLGAPHLTARGDLAACTDHIITAKLGGVGGLMADAVIVTTAKLGGCGGLMARAMVVRCRRPRKKADPTALERQRALGAARGRDFRRRHRLKLKRAEVELSRFHMQVILGFLHGRDVDDPKDLGAAVGEYLLQRWQWGGGAPKKTYVVTGTG